MIRKHMCYVGFDERSDSAAGEGGNYYQYGRVLVLHIAPPQAKSSLPLHN